MPTLELLPSGDGFVLRKYRTNTSWDDFSLSKDDVLTLAQSAAGWSQLVLESQPPTANPVSASPLRQFR